MKMKVKMTTEKNANTAGENSILNPLRSTVKSAKRSFNKKEKLLIVKIRDYLILNMQCWSKMLN